MLYALVRRLLAGMKTFFQSSWGTIYQFGPEFVTVVHDPKYLKYDPGDVVLVDSGEYADGRPEPVFVHSRCFVLQAASGTLTRWRLWVNQKSAVSGSCARGTGTRCISAGE